VIKYGFQFIQSSGTAGGFDLSPVVSEMKFLQEVDRLSVICSKNIGVSSIFLEK
jgi:hypothetical protein